MLGIASEWTWSILAALSSLLLTLGLSGAILVAELVGGLASGSLALISDAGHVLTDRGKLFVTNLGVRCLDEQYTRGR